MVERSVAYDEPTTPFLRWFFARLDPAARYIFRMWLTSLLGALAIGLLVTAVFPSQGPDEQDLGGSWLFVIFGVVIFSPIVETLLMGPVLWLIGLATRRPVSMAIASAVVWGALHSALHPTWGLTVAWPFFVFSCAYLAWRPFGWRYAFAVTATIHALHNALPAAIIIAAG